jgi:hypothetical protein
VEISELRTTRERCEEKITYYQLQHADSMLGQFKKFKSKTYKNARIYECNICGWYHITGDREKDKKMNKLKEKLKTDHSRLVGDVDPAYLENFEANLETAINLSDALLRDIDYVLPNISAVDDGQIVMSWRQGSNICTLLFTGGSVIKLVYVNGSENIVSVATSIYKMFNDKLIERIILDIIRSFNNDKN